MRTVLLALMIVTPVVAQCTVRTVVHTPHVVHAPVVVHHKPTVRVIALDRKVVVVDDHHERVIVVPVEVQRDHYYSLDRENILIDASVGRFIRLQQEGKIPTLGGPAPESKRPPAGTTPPVTEVPKGTSTGGPAVAGAYQNDKLLAVVNNSCAKCHGPESKQTRLVTADGKLADVSAGKVWESFGLTNIGKMPKAPGKQLTNEEVELFVEWAENARK